jgi:hypothetical protein
MDSGFDPRTERVISRPVVDLEALTRRRIQYLVGFACPGIELRWA